EFVTAAGRGRTSTPTTSSPLQSRRNDEDTSALSRRRRLQVRSEAEIRWEDARRTSVSFQRTFPTERNSLDTMDGRNLDVNGPDFARLMKTADNAFVTLPQGPAPVLTTQGGGLRFGTLTLKAGNLAPDYPGSYSLWLRRSGDKWWLVFNNQPDLWGSQHDASSDVGAIELAYSAGH